MAAVVTVCLLVICLLLLFMVLAVSAAYRELQQRVKHAEEVAEIAKQGLAQIEALAQACAPMVDPDVDPDSLIPDRPEGWYGMHES